MRVVPAPPCPPPPPPLLQAKVPKDAKVLVGCQKGLRSLAACEQLSLGGYKTLAWVNGGFDTCKAGEAQGRVSAGGGEFWGGVGCGEGAPPQTVRASVSASPCHHH